MPPNLDKSYLFVQNNNHLQEYDPSCMVLRPIHGSYLVMLRPQAKGKFMVAVESNGVDWSLIDFIRGVGGYGSSRIPLIGESNKPESLALYGGNFRYNNDVWTSSPSDMFPLTHHDPKEFKKFISKLTLEERTE